MDIANFYTITLFTTLGLILPFLAWNSWRVTSDPAFEVPEQSHRAVFIQVFVLQTFVLSLAVLAMERSGLSITVLRSVSLGAAGWLIAVVTLTLVLAKYESNRLPAAEKAARERIRHAADRPWAWLLLTIYASTCEEIVFRGVATALLSIWLGAIPGVGVSALLFGLAHLAGGPRAALMAVPFALAMQWLAFIGEGLWLAILGHAIYDLGAAVVGKRLAKVAPG